MILSQEEQSYLLSVIRDVPNFPKEGIIFKDITTLLSDAKAFAFLMNHLAQRYKEYNLDYVAGIDSRGFIFGAALAQMLGVGFVPVRKKGKLPSKTFRECFDLEYGQDCIEMHTDSFSKPNARVLLIDDLIATGGTATAAVKLIQDLNAECVEACFILSLDFLPGKANLSNMTPVYSVLGLN